MNSRWHKAPLATIRRNCNLNLQTLPKRTYEEATLPNRTPANTTCRNFAFLALLLCLSFRLFLCSRFNAGPHAIRPSPPENTFISSVMFTAELFRLLQKLRALRYWTRFRILVRLMVCNPHLFSLEQVLGNDFEQRKLTMHKDSKKLNARTRQAD